MIKVVTPLIFKIILALDCTMAAKPIRLNPVPLVVCFDSGDWEEH